MSTRKGPRRLFGLSADDGPWPAEDVRKLKLYVASNLSYARIARKLRRTRNQVIGKVHRLGLREPTSRERIAADNSLALRIASVNRQAERQKGATVRAHVSIAWVPDRVVGIEELGEAACRWPVGDPKKHGFGYCGCKRATGYAYCEAHVSVAYVSEPEAIDPVAIAA